MIDTKIMKAWSTLIIVLVFFTSITACTTSNKPKLGTAQSQISAVKTWQRVAIFEGNNTKNNQRFKITSNDWRLNWSTEPTVKGASVFQIYAFNNSGKLLNPGILANIIGKGSSTSNMHGSGTYFITINTTQSYKIDIEEYK